MVDTDIREAYVLERALEIQFENDKVLRFEDCWLRDHCRCTNCYQADTYQRAKHILDIPDEYIMRINYEKTRIIVFWEDGHKSEYTSEFLFQFDYQSWSQGRRLKPILWHGNEVADKIVRLQVNEFLNSIDGARSAFKSLLDYGVVLIEEVEPTMQATEKVCEAFGGVQQTIFGGMWEFTTRPDHADTAYTNLPLAVHNDNTYFTEASGLQILHCLEHVNGTGGETILVDGFYGATRLKEEHPKDFEFLTTFDVEAEYIEEGHHYKYAAPVINVNKNEDLKQIRFNVYDRSPMAFSNSDDCRSYYRCLRSLACYYQDPTNQWLFKLKPGVVMVMDNFRVLHGRTGFSGSRRLGGCYVARSDWLDRARTLGLIQ